MKRPVLILLSVVVVLGLVAWLVLRPTSENVTADFIAEFPNAVEKRPTPETFSVVKASLGGEAKEAIRVTSASRIAWRLTVPENGWLNVSAGLAEEAWTVPGDGVLFRISANDDELLSVVLNPYGDPGARRWHDFSLDLSEYAGETMNIFLKTNAGPPGKNDANGDISLWGAPRVVTR